MEVTIENESKLRSILYLPSRKAKDEIERTIGTKNLITGISSGKVKKKNEVTGSI